MIRLSQGEKSADVRLSKDELILINNALNEVCNGFELDDAEFATRVGADREVVRRLLENLGSLIR